MYNFQIVNCDTDSISFCKQDQSVFSKEEQENLLNELNSLYPEKIKFSHDGYFSSVLVIKAKNYALKKDDGKIKIKGSALVASMKELALKDFLNEVIDLLLNGKKDEILELYNKYIIEIHNLTEINKWTSKKTITESVLNPKRTNEQKVLDAVKNKDVQMGDKIRIFFTKDQSLKLEEDWSNDHCTHTLMSKLYKTLEIFETVLDMTQFTKYTLKSHEVQCKLAQLLGLPEPIKEKKTRKKKEEMV